MKNGIPIVGGARRSPDLRTPRNQHSDHERELSSQRIEILEQRLLILRETAAVIGRLLQCRRARRFDTAIPALTRKRVNNTHGTYLAEIEISEGPEPPPPKVLQ
jgi:hypothetical protein